MRRSVKFTLWAAIVVAVVVGVGAVTWAVALAAIPGNNGVISACYKLNNPAKGAVVVIDAEAGDTCPSGYAALNWNQTGPAGPQGPAGVSGYEVVTVSAGPGSFRTIVSCPAGKSAISGGVRWNGLGIEGIEKFHVVGSYPTSDSSGWISEYALSGTHTVDAFAVCALV